MRKNRVLMLGLTATLLVGAVSSVGMARTRARGQASGSWTFTDFTPDPTVFPNPGEQHCSGGALPAAPGDVNEQPITVKKTSTLTLTSHNASDWAMEVRTADGTWITGVDGASPTDPENMTISLAKGKYVVVYCNFAGEPEITVDYELAK